MQLADRYPPDALGGADFLTSAAQRLLIDAGNDGLQIRRTERVIVTDRIIKFEDRLQGRACFSEQTVRAMGALIGLYDRTYVASLTTEIDAKDERLGRAEAENVELKRLIAAVQGGDLVLTLYVAPDGTEYASREALLEATNPPSLRPPADPRTLETT